MEEKNIEIANEPDKEFWVWMLTVEDINEFEHWSNLWSSKAAAKAAMERSIEEWLSVWEAPELHRDDDEHADLGERIYWEIKKMKVNN